MFILNLGKMWNTSFFHQTVDADHSKSPEGLLGVLGHMLSGKSLDLLLAAAAATGKLKSFARKFIKWVKWSGALLCSSSQQQQKKPLPSMGFLSVGSMSFQSTLAVKDVSVNTKQNKIRRNEWLVFDLWWLWLLLFSSQVCLSSSPAFWHLLPHVVPRGADLWLWGS